LRRIEYMGIDELPPALVNVKHHDAEAVAASMTRFGFVDPVILDERTQRLIAGHGRIEALALLWSNDQAPPEGIGVEGGVWSIPVVRGWSSRDDDEAAALGVAVNQLVITGGFDDEALAELLGELNDREVSFEGLGFMDYDLPGLLGELPTTYDLIVVCEHESQRAQTAAFARSVGATARYLTEPE
jgi:hypothetical protein